MIGEGGGSLGAQGNTGRHRGSSPASAAGSVQLPDADRDVVAAEAQGVA